jgi:hypothetical protein
MICGHHYMRRCIHCWFDQRLPLPAVKKRVIYLDQFVISNIMKELDPANKNCAGVLQIAVRETGSVIQAAAYSLSGLTDPRS